MYALLLYSFSLLMSKEIKMKTFLWTPKSVMGARYYAHSNGMSNGNGRVSPAYRRHIGVWITAANKILKVHKLRKEF